MMIDIERGGAMRRWIVDRDGVKRWVDTGAPIEPECDRSACGDHSPGPCDHPQCEALQPPKNGD